MNQVATVFYRKCAACGRGMNEGYQADGAHYCPDTYCSDKCLQTKYTAEEWEELADDGNSDEFYWTEWLEAGDPDDPVYTADGVEIGQAI